MHLPENHAQRLEGILKISVDNLDIKLKTLQVIPGKIDELLRFLNGLVNTTTTKLAGFVKENEPGVRANFRSL